MAAPHAVGRADGTGQLNTGDGLYGDPLTVAAADSRVHLGGQARSATRAAEATPVCTRLFHAFGVPQRLRTDHGVPCATKTLGRLAPRSAWWVRLGRLPACLAPGTPQQNGRHERRHRTLQADTTRPPTRPRRAQPRTCDRCREACNGQRPHEALDMRPPAAGDAPSPRKMPHQPPPLAAPDRFEGRDVSANGGIRWNRQWVNVSPVGVGEDVGREELDDGVWHVDFGPLNLGRWLDRHRRSEEAYGRRTQRR
jgi:putative transposase